MKNTKNNTKTTSTETVSERKWTPEVISAALENGAKPEGMSNTYWSKLKRGLVGKCYGVEANEKPVKTEKKKVETSEPVEIAESSVEEDDSEQTTTVVEMDGTVRIISSSSV